MSELAVGLMSGTSLDGIDAALVEIGGETRVRLIEFLTQPFDPERRARVLHATAHGTARDLALLHVELGGALADAALAVLGRAGRTPRDLALVASHGQTVWHEPGRATLQLGSAAELAERLGAPVVSDFRSRDVAAGGQGAPLVSMADVMLFGHPAGGRALVNLGGMANVTWVPRREDVGGVVACDTGPGVAIVDTVTRMFAPDLPYDVDGRLARAGAPESSVVDDLLAAPFFAAPPPKSTGRETFGETYAVDLVDRVRARRPGATPADMVATAVALTVRAVALHLDRLAPAGTKADVLVSGGGARNPVMLEQLRRASRLPVRPFDEEFFDGDAKEAVAFAYLGWRTLRGLPGNVPGATGAKGGRVLGVVTG